MRALLSLLALACVLLACAPGLAGQLSFEPPRKLSDGEVSLFHAAADENVSHYSDGTEIHIYTYETAAAADNDFVVVARSADKVAAETDATLAEMGAVTFSARGVEHVSVRMNETILDVCYNSSSLSRSGALGLAAEMCSKARQRARDCFKTPRATLETLYRAAEEGNEPLALACFAEPLPDGFRKRTTGKLGTNRLRSGVGSGPDFTIRETIVAEENRAECRIEVAGSNVWNTPWFQMLRDGLADQTFNNYQTARNKWLPFVKQDGLWRIDVAAVKEKGLSRTVEDHEGFLRLMECRQKFYGLNNCVREWMRDHPQLPEDPRELIRSNYGTDLLVDPGGNASGVALDEYGSNLRYFPYRSDKVRLIGDLVVFCTRKGAHIRPEETRVFVTLSGRVMIEPEKVAEKYIGESEKFLADEGGTVAEEGTPDTPAAAEPLTDEETARLENLIRGLGADSFDEREKSQKVLIDFGPRAAPIVKQALESEDDEVKWRAQNILKAYRSGK